jgi:Ser/Thr protein kinase RdoA (MazF antagonist)
MEFVEGDLLDDLEFTSADQSRSVGLALGSCLAAIHSVTFTQVGFLGPGLAVEPLPVGGRGVLGLFEMLLNDDVVRGRLADLLSQFGRVIAEGTPALEALDLPAVLVHSDFNAKNILMRAGEPGVAAVLD